MGRWPAFPERPDDWYARRDHSVVGRPHLVATVECVHRVVSNCVASALFMVGTREVQRDPRMTPGPHAGILFR